MALLWCDGFDHYGLDESNMLDGVYAAVDTDHCNLSTTQAATGTHSFRFHNDVSGSFDSPSLRKVLPSSTDKLGVFARFYFEQLPTDSLSNVIVEFLTTSAGRGHISCIVNSNGAIGFYRGTRYSAAETDGTLIAQTDPILVASAWNHVEIQVYLHDTDGWIRVAVNGVHRYEGTGLDTKFDSTECSAVGHTKRLNPGHPWYMDDYAIYDFTGDSAVDTDFCPATDGSGKATNYIGELQVIYCPMNGDTAEDDWAPSTGSDSYAMIDEVDPNDADYVSSTAAGDLSEYDITDLPEDITYIRGVQLLGRMSKSDAGAAMIKFGMKSVAATDDADERPVTVAPTYWWDFMNVDPDSGARWTRASLNAAWFRLTRNV